jgi:hypothetical protein
LGILLKPKEFQRVTLISIQKNPDMADQLERLGADLSMVPTRFIFKEAAWDPSPGEEGEAPEKVKAFDYWEQSPDLIKSILSWMSPDDFGPYNLPSEKQVITSSKNDADETWTVPKHSSQIRFIPDVAAAVEKYAWERSGYSKALYCRMLDALAPHTQHVKTAFLPGMALMPPGPNKIIVIQGGGESSSSHHEDGELKELLHALLRDKAGKPSEGGNSKLEDPAEMVKTMYALKMLHDLYREKMGSLQEQDEALYNISLRHPILTKLGYRRRGDDRHPIFPSDEEEMTRDLSAKFADQLSEERHYWKRAFRRSLGLPTRAFFKYAYVGLPHRECDYVEPLKELHCHTMFLEMFLAEPLHNLDKRASVLDVSDQNVIDAATVTGLSFARRVFSGNQS